MSSGAPEMGGSVDVLEQGSPFRGTRNRPGPQFLGEGMKRQTLPLNLRCENRKSCARYQKGETELVRRAQEGGASRMRSREVGEALNDRGCNERHVAGEKNYGIGFGHFKAGI